MEFLRFAGLALAITQRAVPGANRAAASDLGGLEDWSLAVDKLKVPTVTVEIIAPLWLTSSLRSCVHGLALEAGSVVEAQGLRGCRASGLTLRIPRAQKPRLEASCQTPSRVSREDFKPSRARSGSLRRADTPTTVSCLGQCVDLVGMGYLDISHALRDLQRFSAVRKLRSIRFGRIRQARMISRRRLQGMKGHGFG